MEPNPDLDVAQLSHKLGDDADDQETIQKSLSFSTILNTQGEIDKEEGDPHESRENRNKRKKVLFHSVIIMNCYCLPSTLNDIEYCMICYQISMSTVLTIFFLEGVSVA